MKNVFLDRISIRAVTKVSSLLVLGVIIVVFLATPLVSLAHDNVSRGTNLSEARKLGGPGLFGKNGCLNQKDVAKCLVPNLDNLPKVCGNDPSDNGDGSNLNCVIPDLSGLPGIGDPLNICGIDLSKILSNVLGNDPNNPKSIAAGIKQKGKGTTGNKPKSLADCGIDLSNLPDLSDLGINGNNPKTISAGTKVSSLPSAQFAGTVQFSAVQPGITPTSTVQQAGNIALAFKIVPTNIASIRKGDFIGAKFNGKLESGVSLGAGKADLFDPVTGQSTTVQLI